MPTLKYLDRSYDCTTAIKGDDYIRLLDSNGCLVASFDGISDFSVFELESGNYTTPTPDHECHVAVIRDDGTLAKGGHKCNSIVSKSKQTTLVIGKTWAGSTAPYTQTLKVSDVTEDSVVEISLPSTATTDEVTAFQKLMLQDGGQTEGSITLRAFGTKNTKDITINVIIRRDL